MPTPARRSDHVHAIAASFLGWTLDAFDFFIVTFVLTDIAREFGKTKLEIAYSLTLTLLFRPVGAFIFGLMADRYGRRLPLMIDLVFFSIIEVLSGLAPNYTTFMVLRALFGIGMGGEWGVGASLAMEKAPRGIRGLLSGLLQEGYATGNLLAALCYLFVFPHWGWRPMFFIGGLPALLALYVRFGVRESEVWEKTRHTEWAHLARAIFANWRTFLFLFVMLTGMGFVSHGTQDLFPTVLKSGWKFNERTVAYIVMVSNVGAIVGGIIMGRYSDSAGRRRTMVMSLLIGLVVIPVWAYAPTVGILVAGAFMIQFLVQGAWGIVPVHINELVPDSVRGFLPGFAYQCGMAAAGLAPSIQEALAGRFGYSAAMTGTCLIAFSVTAFIVRSGTERHAAEFGTSATAQ